LTAAVAVTAAASALLMGPAGAHDATAPQHLALDGVGQATTTPGFDKLATAVLTDVDGYWTRVMKDNGYAEPTVTYDWIPAGQSVVDGCSDQPTDDTAAFYCPADDTIYLSESMAASVRTGDMQWPSGDTPSQALGDAAVAYVIAHEEGHN